MGSLSGHLLPGSFFAIFGLWWTWGIFHKYFITQLRITEDVEFRLKRRNNRFKYQNTPTISHHCPWLPLEGILKVIVTFSGIIGELVTAYEDGKFVHYGNVQHITMYFFFGLNGVIDILTFYRKNLIHDLDYVSGCLAFLIEGILFLYHLDGMDELETRVHILLVYLILGSIISSISESILRYSIWPALLRIYFTLLQGTWFCQIGFILYVYQWDPENPDVIKSVTFLYTWHFAIAFLILLASGHFIRWKVTRWRDDSTYRTSYALPSVKDTTVSTSRSPKSHENSIDTDSDEL